jgi:hypothetical protein
MEMIRWLAESEGWRERLQAGDKVIVLFGDAPNAAVSRPISRVEKVEAVTPEYIILSGGRRFVKETGFSEDNSFGNSALLREYTPEGKELVLIEKEERVLAAKDREALARMISATEWESLPLDKLERIRTILDEPNPFAC